MKDPSPWNPITKPIDLKHLGKLGEELNECGAAVFRCIIQGLEEREPETGKLNSVWLEEELADVIANTELVIEHFNLFISKTRIATKKEHLRRWHQMLERKE